MSPGPESLLERDPSLKKRFLALIVEGVPRKFAALGCGFSYRTLYGWVHKGLLPGAPALYQSFAWEFYQAELTLLRKYLKRKQKAKITMAEQRALEWLLERRFPLAFGRNAVALPDPVDDIEKELDQAEQSAGQLEAGGDGGALDEERWGVVRAWFQNPDEKLVQLALETGLADRAVEAKGGK